MKHYAKCDKTVKPKKKRTEKNKESETELENYDCTSSEGESWNDINLRDREKQLAEKKLEAMSKTDTIKKGDHVLMKVEGKKTVSYFVAEVMDIEQNQIKYLRRIASNKFIHDFTETYDFNLEDVICKLPTPHSAGGTARQSSILQFDVSFDGKSVGGHKTWINDEIKESSKNLKDLFHLKTRYHNLTEAYTVAKNLHYKLLRDTKNEFYQNKIVNSDNPIREAWKVVGEFSKRATPRDRQYALQINNNIITDPPTPFLIILINPLLNPLIPPGTPVAPLKLRDVSNLLSKHFGDDWKSLNTLSFYKNLTMAESEDDNPQDVCQNNDDESYLLQV
ncbi:hypothetical protein QE152_g185 [Popillia japonica]|uniref:Uncharacterized protein n=1 Tax=Popillia japonica TaxID=7064 RepID=A0AAW1NK18_POPJA